MLQQILTYAERKSPSLTRNSSGAKVDVAETEKKPKNPPESLPDHTKDVTTETKPDEGAALEGGEGANHTSPSTSDEDLPPRRADGNADPTTKSPASRHGVHPPRPGSPTLRRESRGSGGDLAGDLAKLRERFGRRAEGEMDEADGTSPEI